MLGYRSSEFSVAQFALLLIASCCCAEETTILATGIDRPTAVAMVGKQIFYADATGIHSLKGTGLSKPEGAIHSLASLDAEHLIVSADEVTLWSLSEDLSRLELKKAVRVIDKEERKPFTSLTTDNRHTFAIRAGKIYRSRWAGHSLTSLRAFGTSWANDITALALSERGYLVLLQAVENNWQLVFADPYESESEPIVAWKVPLKTKPLALAYSPLPYPTEHRLYTLTSDGLYRLDAVVGDTVGVTKIADIPHAVAMAFALDGTLYVAALTEDETGVLLRLDGPL